MIQELESKKIVKKMKKNTIEDNYTKNSNK